MTSFICADGLRDKGLILGIVAVRNQQYAGALERGTGALC